MKKINFIIHVNCTVNDADTFTDIEHEINCMLDKTDGDYNQIETWLAESNVYNNSDYYYFYQFHNSNMINQFLEQIEIYKSHTNWIKKISFSFSF